MDYEGRKPFHLATDLKIQQELAHGEDVLLVAVMQQDVNRVKDIIEVNSNTAQFIYCKIPNISPEHIAILSTFWGTYIRGWEGL